LLRGQLVYLLEAEIVMSITV